MAEGGVFIPFQDAERDPQLKAALAAYVAAQLGRSQPLEEIRSADEGGLAELSETQAKLFLNNCSDKTTDVIRFIIAKNGVFMISELHRQLRVTSLRGVWTGLTRRLRNITQDDEATLLNWYHRPNEDDWRGVMAKRTVRSFELALVDRA